MSNLQARLASGFLFSVAASLTLIAGSNVAARAADSCITEPKTETPQGKHWYYRIERGTARHCWYLRGEDEASARTPGAEPVAAAPAPQTTGNAPPRSLADARAELAPKARVEDNSSAPPARSVFPDPPAVTPATTGIGPGAGAATTPADSQLASRWPQASGTPSTMNAASMNAAPRASLMVADAQADEAASATPVLAEPTQASPPPAREVGSLQKLALVVFGALALAGLSGSLVYRLAGARSRRRRQERWPQRQPIAPSLADEARGAPWIAPELSPTVPHEDIAHEDVAHEEEVDRIKFGKSDDSFEKIEDFLARLTKQLQDELQTAHATELEKPHPQ